MADLLDFNPTDDRARELELYGYKFQFDVYLDKSYKLYKARYMQFTGFTLLYFIMYGFASLVVGGLAGLIQPAFNAGSYLVAHRIDREQNTELSNFFDGFKYSGQIILSVLVAGLIMIAAFIPFFVFLFYNIASITGGEILGSSLMVAFFIFIAAYLIFFIFIGVSTSLCYLFIVFWDMGFWDAFKASYRVVIKKWWHFFGFYIILFLISLAGYIIPIVLFSFAFSAGIFNDSWLVLILASGFFFIITTVIITPYTQCAMYVMFEDIVGIKSEKMMPPTPNKMNFATKDIPSTETELPPTPDKANLGEDKPKTNPTDLLSDDDWKILY